MKKVRTPDEIQLEITRLEWKLRELREELHISDAVNNPNYQEYKGKWVFHDAYESGWSCVYVLGVTINDDDVYFYWYGVVYNEQTKELTVVSKDYPRDFYICYPDNLPYYLDVDYDSDTYNGVDELVSMIEDDIKGCDFKKKLRRLISVVDSIYEDFDEAEVEFIKDMLQ